MYLNNDFVLELNFLLSSRNETTLHTLHTDLLSHVTNTDPLLPSYLLRYLMKDS